MTTAQKNRFKLELEAKREDLIRKIAEHRARFAVDLAGDRMDQVRSIADREFAIRDSGRISGVLRLVERALHKMQDATYGVCACCDEKIPLKRLQAVPWLLCCVQCQEQAEKSEIHNQPLEAEYAIAS